MLKTFSRKRQIHYQHLISQNAQHILQEHFPQLFQTKFSTFPVGFLNLVPRQHHLVNTTLVVVSISTLNRYKINDIISKIDK
jgi:hypothetical protein